MSNPITPEEWLDIVAKAARLAVLLAADPATRVLYLEREVARAKLILPAAKLRAEAAEEEATADVAAATLARHPLPTVDAFDAANTYDMLGILNALFGSSIRREIMRRERSADAEESKS